MDLARNPPKSGAQLRFVALALCLGAIACGGRTEEPAAYLSVELEYAGGASCQRCHEREYDEWTGSHHDLAMQEVSAETVLADFDDSTFEHQGVTSTFFRRGDEYWVNTEGPDGELADYRVAYVFGIDPLQQYLLEFPGGRLQALSIPWDTRPVEQGGQRWFHLYPDEEIPAGDVLHWTGPNQNWNYMCAECHSTDLRKGYDAATDTYDTTWEEIDVSCESCHGPGSRHNAWAEEYASTDGESGEVAPSSMGLVVDLGDADDPAWVFDDTGVARRHPARTSNTQVEACARCHSRRGVIRDPYLYGRPLLDTHRLSLLEPNLYHPDGQILEEVYVYGSFLQSRMHAAGVTCSDCHDSHSAGLLNEGNALCSRCHLAEKYDTKDHHKHPEDNEPSTRCVACHMRSENYMVVDRRRDHSFRIPRPDLSVELGSPNACTDCHRETSLEWSVERFAEWWPDRMAQPHYGRVLHAAGQGTVDAVASLMALVDDTGQSGIVRATALERLAENLGPEQLGAVERATRDADPVVRMAAAGALEAVDPASRAGLGRHLLPDPVLAVRIEAARALATTPASQFDAAGQAEMRDALNELRQAQLVNADRSEARIVLGSIYAQGGQLEEARAEYEAALALEPNSVAARINLADLHRQAGDESSAENVLRAALGVDPEDPDAHHALGLTLVRQGRNEEALTELERAAELAPDNLRYGYVYAIAAHSTGRIPKAIRILQQLHERWPTNQDVLIALASYFASMGGFAEAEEYARKLVELAPDDPQAQALLQQIQSQRR